MITKISQVKVGQFIKYIFKDKREKITYIGEVTVVDKAHHLFEMITFEGEIGFTLAPVETDENMSVFGKKPDIIIDDSTLEIVKTKPKGWAKFLKNPDSFVKQNDVVVEQKKTFKQQVFELVKANPKKKLNALIKLSLKEIGGSESQLKTIIQLAILKR